MIIGCPKEIMPREGRRGLRMEDEEKLKELGAEVISPSLAWEMADLIVKVKQPLPEEFKYFRSGLIIAAFHHLAANLPLMECALNTGVTLIDYGTIQRADGFIPALAAMSRIAGEIAVWDGAKLLKRYKRVILRSGINASIIGMGNAGLSAARLILPTGARLFCFDKNQSALDNAQSLFRNFSPYQVWYIKYNQNIPCDQTQLAAILKNVDLLIGCTHTVGESTGKPVPAWMIGGMPRNSVAIDISIDMGGCFESSSRFFKTGEQHFVEYGVRHICEPNMPGRISKISMPALCAETFPRIKQIAQKGLARAARENPALASGIVVHKGYVTCRALAEDRVVNRMDRYKPLEEVL